MTMANSELNMHNLHIACVNEKKRFTFQEKAEGNQKLIDI